nr:MAG TPA: hypothetical protein [Caudoviricetes sp.]
MKHNKKCNKCYVRSFTSDHLESVKNPCYLRKVRAQRKK